MTSNIKKIALYGIIALVVVAVLLFAVSFLAKGGEGGKQNGLSDFLPFGVSPFDNSGGQLGEQSTLGEEETPGASKTGTSTAPKLTRLTSFAVAGATAFEREVENEIGEKEEALVVRFMERSTGHMYDIVLKNGKRLRISNTTIPQVAELLWGEKGETAVARYVNADNETIESFSGEIIQKEELPEGSFEGTFLESGISSLVYSPDKTKYFYLKKTDTGAEGIVTSAKTAKSAVLLDTSFTQWIPQWVNSRNIFLTTKASSEALGYLYSLDAAAGGALKKVFGGFPGFTTLANPSGSRILYSKSVQGGFALSLFDTKAHLSTRLGLSTLPEKCLWRDDDVVLCAVPDSIPLNIYPDAWYQGLVSFSDTIWSINADTGVTKVLAKPADLHLESIDAIDLFTDPQNKYLFFTNKKTGTLWALKMEGNDE